MIDAITKTAFFAATPETVWLYLTDKDKLGEWFHPAHASLAEGESFELYRLEDDGTKVRQIRVRVLRADRPRLLIHTFAIDPFEGDETTVIWRLEPSGSGTRLTLVHEGVAAAMSAVGDKSGDALNMLMMLDHGWDAHLQQLRDVLSKT